VCPPATIELFADDFENDAPIRYAGFLGELVLAMQIPVDAAYRFDGYLPFIPAPVNEAEQYADRQVVLRLTGNVFQEIVNIVVRCEGKFNRPGRRFIIFGDDIVRPRNDGAYRHDPIAP